MVNLKSGMPGRAKGHDPLRWQVSRLEDGGVATDVKLLALRDIEARWQGMGLSPSHIATLRNRIADNREVEEVWRGAKLILAATQGKSGLPESPEKVSPKNQVVADYIYEATKQDALIEVASALKDSLTNPGAMFGKLAAGGKPHIVLVGADFIEEHRNATYFRAAFFNLIKAFKIDTIVVLPEARKQFDHLIELDMGRVSKLLNNAPSTLKSRLELAIKKRAEIKSPLNLVLLGDSTGYPLPSEISARRLAAQVARPYLHGPCHNILVFGPQAQMMRPDSQDYFKTDPDAFFINTLCDCLTKCKFGDAVEMSHIIFSNLRSGGLFIDEQCQEEQQLPATGAFLVLGTNLARVDMIHLSDGRRGRRIPWDGIVYSGEVDENLASNSTA